MHMPAATAAPDPPLEPPGMLFASQGLRVAPVRGFAEVDPIANSSRFVLPTTIAPCFFRRETAGASRSGTYSDNDGDPAVVLTPAVSKLSLIASGIPSRSRAAS